MSSVDLPADQPTDQPTDQPADLPADLPPGALPPSAAELVSSLAFNDAGLVCAVVQQFDTKEVLMVAWMDAEALRRTLTTGRGTYFSRSRREYWVKGETSGNTQRVVEVRRDCDRDTLLVQVDQTGVACHTGTRTCFDGIPAVQPS